MLSSLDVSTCFITEVVLRLTSQWNCRSILEESLGEQGDSMMSGEETLDGVTVSRGCTILLGFEDYWEQC